MPVEMSLFSAMQKKLLETQTELDRVCGERYAESRATLLSLITDDLPRFQLYTETVANLVLDIGAQQAQLLQRIRLREQPLTLVQTDLPREQEKPTIQFVNVNLQSTKMDSSKSDKPSVEQPQKKSTSKSILATLAFIGSAFSRDPATSFGAYSSASSVLEKQNKQRLS